MIADESGHDMESLLNADSRRKDLGRALSWVPRHYKVAIALQLKGYTHDEIARELQISPKSVQKYLARGVAYAKSAASKHRYL